MFFRCIQMNRQFPTPFEQFGHVHVGKLRDILPCDAEVQRFRTQTRPMTVRTRDGVHELGNPLLERSRHILLVEIAEEVHYAFKRFAHRRQSGDLALHVQNLGSAVQNGIQLLLVQVLDGFGQREAVLLC